MYVCKYLCYQVTEEGFFVFVLTRSFSSTIPFWCRHQGVLVKCSVFLLLSCKREESCTAMWVGASVLPKDFTKVKIKALIFNTFPFARKHYSNDGNLTASLVIDWLLVSWNWAVLQCVLDIPSQTAACMRTPQPGGAPVYKRAVQEVLISLLKSICSLVSSMWSVPDSFFFKESTEVLPPFHDRCWNLHDNRCMAYAVHICVFNGWFNEWK